jgi:hypothetical protein
MLKRCLVGCFAALVLAGACSGEITSPGVASEPSVDAPESDGGLAAASTDLGVDAGEVTLARDFDDRIATVATAADVAKLRARLIRRIWGTDTLPASLPIVTAKTEAEVGVAIPAGLSNLVSTSVLQLDFPTMNPMPPNGTDGGNGMAFLLTPLEASRHRVVVLGAGHATTFDDPETSYGMRDVVQALLTQGYSVLLMYMPHYTPSDSTAFGLGTGSHALMFSDGANTPGVGPLDATNYRYFLEPTIVAVNYLASPAAPGGAFTDIALAGLSGGAWTTTMAAALDPRPRLSIAVAAALPGFMVQEATQDAEQLVRSRLGVGYADLHVLGADGLALGGAPRRQTHVLNRRDNCCFGELGFDDRGGITGTWQSSLRLFEANVRAALFSLGSAGRFRVEIDEMADHHMVSSNTLQAVLLAELGDDRKLVAAASAKDEMFYRGVNGDLWRRTFPSGGGSTEVDTGVAIAGVAVVAEGGPNAVDVFARDATTGGGADNLVHYFLPTGQSTWTRQTLPASLLADPGVAAGGGTFDVVGLANDGSLRRYSSSTGALELVSADVFAGPPAVVRRGDALHVFARSKDMALHHLWRSSASTAWSAEPLAMLLSGFPTASACGDLVCVAAVGLDLKAAVGTIDGSGTFSGWSALASSVPLRGSPSLGVSPTPPPTGGSNPSATTPGGSVTLYVSTDHGTLGRFFQPAAGGAWTFVDLQDATVASPMAITATGGAVISGGQAGALWVRRGMAAPLGGWFD